MSDQSCQRKKYLMPELGRPVEKVLKEATGATRVHIFDHTKRNGHASIEEVVGGEKKNGSSVTASGPKGQLLRHLQTKGKVFTASSFSLSLPILAHLC